MQTIDEIIADFELLDDWEDRYRYLIELGRALPDLGPDEMTEATKVRGCVSQVCVSCSVAACEHGTFPGSELGLNGSYNNDKITDFISGTNKQSVLDDMLLTSLDTFLTPSVPVATPADLLSQDLYSSPRFFWAPVLTTAFSTSTNAFYPILTFRPTFITEETPSTSATAISRPMSTPPPTGSWSRSTTTVSTGSPIAWEWSPSCRGPRLRWPASTDVNPSRCWPTSSTRGPTSVSTSTPRPTTPSIR